MKKRILSLALSLVMLFSLTTPSAWAAPGDAEQPTNQTVNGSYSGETWTQGGTGSLTHTIDGSSVTLSKTATPVAGQLNTYDVALRVETSTSSSLQTDSAATVLVIDTSGSMRFCAECGADPQDSNYRDRVHKSTCSHYKTGWGADNSITTAQNRMTAAKNAALLFLNGQDNPGTENDIPSYAGTDTSAYRWLAIVDFASSGEVVLNWTNVATAAGKQAAINEINDLAQGGGTNLDDGLYDANTLLRSNTIAQVPAAARNVIALTDGTPTYCRSTNGGSYSYDGQHSDSTIITRTTNTANTVKSATGGNAKIYTVCFGVANEKTYSDGPTVGNFLRDSIASPAEAATATTAAKTYAYNADNTAELMNAFGAITESITSGLDGAGWTATDPMPGYIDVSSAPAAITAEGSTYTWTLSDPETNTSGDTTTYVYTVTYRITIDHTQVEEGVFYPANEPTYLTVDGEQYAFPVPGVTAVYPEYTVTYQYTGEVPAGAPAVPAKATYKYKDTVTVADAPKLEGYNFSGWSRTGEFSMPNNDVTITGSWAIRSDLEYTVNYYWNDGTDTFKVADSKLMTGQTFMDVVTERPIDVAGYTPVSDASKSITIAVEGNVINFYYYKNVEIVAKSDTKVYNGTEHSVSGFTGAPDEADFSAITVGAKGTKVGTYPAAFAAGVVGTVDKTAKYIITKATDGELIITPLGGVVVTITGNRDEVDYDGAQHSVSGYEISSIKLNGEVTTLYTEKDFAFVGVDADKTAEGTNVGTHAMGLKSEHFKNTNDDFTDVQFVVNDGQLKINPVDLTITAGSATKVYDGTALTKNSAVADGLAEGDKLDSVTVTGSQTIVGSSANVASGAVIKDDNGNDVTGNYTISYVDGTLEVTKRAVTVTAGSGTKTYDGTALTKDSAVADGLAAGDELDSFTVTGSQTVVGSSANVPSEAKIVNAKGEDVTASYDITYANGTLTVTPKALTITADDANKIYDGTALTKDTYTSTALAAGDSIASVTVTGSQTVVGKSDNVPSAAVINNAAGENVTASYDITYVNGELEVTPKAVTITALSDTRVYTGQPLTRDEASASGLADGDSIESVTITGSQTNVGKTDNAPSDAKIVNAAGEDVTASYAITYANGTLEVTKRNVKLTSGTASKEYDGEPLTKDEVSVSGEGFVTGEDASYDVTGSQTLVGSSDNTFTYELKEGTSADNYNITTEFGKLTVTDRNVKYEITVEANSASATYDGDEHTAEGFKTLTFTVEGKIYTVEGLNASVTKVSAGTYTNEITGTAVVKDANGNDVTAQFAVNEIDGKLVIDKKALTITADSDEKEYDGTALTKDSYYTNTALAEGDEFESVTVTGSQTVKGSSANEASNAVIVNADGEDVTASYDITYVNGTLEVTKKALTITADDATKPYDGKALTKDSYTNTDLAEGDSFDSVTVTGSQTVVGTSNNVPSAAVIKNTAGEDVTDSYDITYVNGTLEVTKKTITITADDATKPYDGKALTKDSYTSTDLAEGDSFDSVTVTGSQTVVGTSNNVPSAAVIKNTAGEDVTASYDITYANGTLEVTKKAITVTADDAQKIYDGEALTKNSYTADALAEGDSFASVTVTGSQTVVGTSDNIASDAKIVNAAGDDVTASYEITYVNGTLEVTKKAVTITADDANKVYDGTALTKDTYTSTALAAGDSFASVTVTGSQTVVGTSDNIASDAKIVNAAGDDVTASYEITYEKGELTVTPKAITVTADDANKVYDGTALTKDTYTSTALAAGDSFASVTVTGSQTVVGTSDNIASDAKIVNAAGDDVTASYEITYANGTLEVTRRPITVQITGNTDSKEYNGATQSVTGYGVTIVDTLYTEDKVQFSGDAVAEGIVVGTYPMNLTESQFSNADNNFDVTFQVTDGWLKITPVADEVIVTITGHTDTEVYNGAEHTVTGYDVTISNPLFTEKDILFSGDASVSGIYVGTYPMGLAVEQFSHENPNFAKVTFNVTDGWLEITPITAEVVITADSDDKMYDGTPLTNDGYTYDAALLIAGDTIDAVVEGTITNVGTVANKVTSHKIYRTVADTREVVDVTACYSNVVYVDGELEITPRAITMTSGSDSKKYDGTPLTATQVTETGDGFIEGEGAAYSDFASITNVGTIDNTFKYTLNEGTLAENYVITQVPGTLTINKHTDAQLVAEGYTGVYDGLNHDGVTAKDVTGDVEGDEWTYSYSTDGETYTAEMPQYKDVGTYTVYVKAENPNYEGDKLITTVPVEITPATIVVTADDHTIATGDPDPELTYQVVTPVEIETPAFSGELVREPGTAKGEYPINQGTLALADGEGFKADNYVLEYVPGTLTILQRALTVDKTVDKEKVRVGDTVTYTITVTNSGEVDLETVAVVDQMLGIEEVIGALAVGESWTKSYTYTTTEADEDKTIVNVAIAGAEGETFGSDDATTEVLPPIPDTGDHTPVTMLSVTMLLSAAGIILMLRKQRKEENA